MTIAPSGDTYSYLIGSVPQTADLVATVGHSSFSDVTLTLDTSIYASGDVMSDTAEVSGAMRITNGTAILQSIVVIDEDDQGIAFDLVFMSANQSLGTKNAAANISDANARDILGCVSIASGDYVDLGGVRIATKNNVGLAVKAATDTDDIFVGTITRGTPTYTANGVRLRLGFIQD
jgi:hypothetical protein